MKKKSHDQTFITNVTIQETINHIFGAKIPFMDDLNTFFCCFLFYNHVHHQQYKFLSSVMYKVLEEM